MEMDFNDSYVERKVRQCSYSVLQSSEEISTIELPMSICVATF